MSFLITLMLYSLIAGGSLALFRKYGIGFDFLSDIPGVREDDYTSFTLLLAACWPVSLPAVVGFMASSKEYRARLISRRLDREIKLLDSDQKDSEDIVLVHSDADVEEKEIV